jgi:hypothetical protein
MIALKQKKVAESVNYREFDFVQISQSSIVYESAVQIVLAAGFSELLALHRFWRQVSHQTIEILIPNAAWSTRLRANIMTVTGVEAVGSISLTGFDQNILVTLS